MKVLPMLLAFAFFSAHASTWTVSHRGHSYQFSDDEGLKLVGDKGTMSLKDRPCSSHLRQRLLASFKASQKPLVKNPKKKSDFVVLETGKNTLYVPAGHSHGKALRHFPDSFAKAVMAEAKLCPLK